MMDYLTESGKVVTDEVFDKMAEEYENGTWGGELGKVVLGRPRLSGEDARVVSFKLPVSRIAAIDKVTEQSGATRSEFLRDAVDRALLSTLAS
jgi:hypothetical protein